MSTIPHVAQAMQTVLTDVADQAGRATNVIQREVKLRGATFTQILAFGWLSDADATGAALAQTAAALGVPITAQGLEQRFTEEAAACLEYLTDLHGTLFFAAATTGSGSELWKSDGNASGTTLVRDIRPGAPGANPTAVPLIANRTYQKAHYPINVFS